MNYPGRGTSGLKSVGTGNRRDSNMAVKNSDSGGLGRDLNDSANLSH